MSSESGFFERYNAAAASARHGTAPPDAAHAAASLLNALKWDEHGLIPVVTQDVETLEVLGVAFTDRTALLRTLEYGMMYYYSRSRKKLWLKGESSGHVQHCKELRVDCDGDAILAKVQQVKGNCHLGFKSCFSYKIELSPSGVWIARESGERVFDPKDVYK
jgi:phosphoribosyl-AMP cyclohydrolase